MVEAERLDSPRCVTGSFFRPAILPVAHQESVRLDPASETGERLDNMLEVFEVVEVIGFDIEDRSEVGLQLQELVGKLAGLDDQVLTKSDAAITAQDFRGSPDHKRRIEVGSSKQVDAHC